MESPTAWDKKSFLRFAKHFVSIPSIYYYDWFNGTASDNVARDAALLKLATTFHQPQDVTFMVDYVKSFLNSLIEKVRSRVRQHPTSAGARLLRDFDVSVRRVVEQHCILQIAHMLETIQMTADGTVTRGSRRLFASHLQQYVRRVCEQYLDKWYINNKYTLDITKTEQKSKISTATSTAVIKRKTKLGNCNKSKEGGKPGDDGGGAGVGERSDVGGRREESSCGLSVGEFMRSCEVVRGLAGQMQVPIELLNQAWRHMYETTLEKVFALSAAGDKLEEAGGARPLSVAEWRVADLIMLYDDQTQLVHEPSVASGEFKTDLKSLEYLFHLISAAVVRIPKPCGVTDVLFGVGEGGAPPAPASSPAGNADVLELYKDWLKKVWRSVHFAYCSSGRVVSCGVLQRRWHELRALAGRCASCRAPPPPPPLCAMLLERFPRSRRDEIPPWPLLVKNALVFDDTNNGDEAFVGLLSDIVETGNSSSQNATAGSSLDAMNSFDSTNICMTQTTTNSANIIEPSTLIPNYYNNSSQGLHNLNTSEPVNNTLNASAIGNNDYTPIIDDDLGTLDKLQSLDPGKAEIRIFFDSSDDDLDFYSQLNIIDCDETKKRKTTKNRTGNKVISEHIESHREFQKAGDISLSSESRKNITKNSKDADEMYTKVYTVIDALVEYQLNLSNSRNKHIVHISSSDQTKSDRFNINALCSKSNNNQTSENMDTITDNTFKIDKIQASDDVLNTDLKNKNKIFMKQNIEVDTCHTETLSEIETGMNNSGLNTAHCANVNSKGDEVAVEDIGGYIFTSNENVCDSDDDSNLIIDENSENLSKNSINNVNKKNLSNTRVNNCELCLKEPNKEHETEVDNFNKDSNFVKVFESQDQPELKKKHKQPLNVGNWNSNVINSGNKNTIENLNNDENHNLRKSKISMKNEDGIRDSVDELRTDIEHRQIKFIFEDDDSIYGMNSHSKLVFEDNIERGEAREKQDTSLGFASKQIKNSSNNSTDSQIAKDDSISAPDASYKYGQMFVNNQINRGIINDHNYTNLYEFPLKDVEEPRGTPTSPTEIDGTYLSKSTAAEHHDNRKQEQIIKRDKKTFPKTFTDQKILSETKVILHKLDDLLIWRLNANGNCINTRGILDDIDIGPAEINLNRISKKHDIRGVDKAYIRNNLWVVRKCRPLRVRLLQVCMRENKKVNLRDIDEVRKINRTVLTAEVAPLGTCKNKRLERPSSANGGNPVELPPAEVSHTLLQEIRTRPSPVERVSLFETKERKKSRKRKDNVGTKVAGADMDFGCLEDYLTNIMKVQYKKTAIENKNPTTKKQKKNSENVIESKLVSVNKEYQEWTRQRNMGLQYFNLPNIKHKTKTTPKHDKTDNVGHNNGRVTRAQAEKMNKGAVKINVLFENPDMDSEKDKLTGKSHQISPNELNLHNLSRHTMVTNTSKVLQSTDTINIDDSDNDGAGERGNNIEPDKRMSREQGWKGPSEIGQYMRSSKLSQKELPRVISSRQDKDKISQQKDVGRGSEDDAVFEISDDELMEDDIGDLAVVVKGDGKESVRQEVIRELNESVKRNTKSRQSAAANNVTALLSESYIGRERYIEVSPHPMAPVLRLDSARPLWIVSRYYLLLTTCRLECAAPTYWTTIKGPTFNMITRILFDNEDFFPNITKSAKEVVVDLTKQEVLEGSGAFDASCSQNDTSAPVPRLRVKTMAKLNQDVTEQMEGRKNEEDKGKGNINDNIYKKLSEFPPIYALVLSVIQEKDTFKKLIEKRKNVYIFSTTTGSLSKLLMKGDLPEDTNFKKHTNNTTDKNVQGVSNNLTKRIVTKKNVNIVKYRDKYYKRKSANTPSKYVIKKYLVSKERPQSGNQKQNTQKPNSPLQQNILQKPNTHEQNFQQQKSILHQKNQNAQQQQNSHTQLLQVTPLACNSQQLGTSQDTLHNTVADVPVISSLPQPSQQTHTVHPIYNVTQYPNIQQPSQILNLQQSNMQHIIEQQPLAHIQISNIEYAPNLQQENIIQQAHNVQYIPSIQQNATNNVLQQNVMNIQPVPSTGLIITQQNLSDLLQRVQRNQTNVVLTPNTIAQLLMNQNPKI